MKITSILRTGAFLSVLVLTQSGSAAIDTYDSLMVRQILDKAGWEAVPVDSVVPQMNLAVSITGTNRVSTLNLTYRAGLMAAPMATLPEEISQLPELVSLSLTGNALTDLPLSISTLHKLTRLDLTANRCTRLPAALGSGDVRNLIISHNLLDSLPKRIDSLVQLQSLVLVGNRLTTLPAGIAKLPGLSTLNLDSNELETLPQELSAVTTLRVSVAGNRLCTIGDTLAKWIDKYHVAADWRASQRCAMDIAAVVTDAATGTVVRISDSASVVKSYCKPVRLSAVAAGAVTARPERQQVLKAVDVRFEACFVATSNYFQLTIPWSDVAGSLLPGGTLSMYLLRGAVAEYLGGTVDSVKKTISIRSNREGTYLLTTTELPVNSGRVAARRPIPAAPMILLRTSGVIETIVTLEQPSLLKLRLLSLDGRVLLTSLRRVSAGTTAVRFDGVAVLRGTVIAEIICNEFTHRCIIQPF